MKVCIVAYTEATNAVVELLVRVARCESGEDPEEKCARFAIQVFLEAIFPSYAAACPDAATRFLSLLEARDLDAAIGHWVKTRPVKQGFNYGIYADEAVEPASRLGDLIAELIPGDSP